MRKDPYELPLAGRIVSAMAFSRAGYPQRLEFWADGNDRPQHLLVIEGDVQLRAGTTSWKGHPNEPEMLALLSQRVQSASANATGDLIISFESGDVLEVDAGAYESWQFEDGAGGSAVSVAGGGLAVWD
ncbi:MAG TPA: DUF6188 family protein [Candidatus Limnocylindrales bacterium]|nr:DUF6188 family protein [Candidatus Limnocylindrales bacterium]